MESNFTIIEDVINVLKPLEDVVEKLSGANATLITFDYNTNLRLELYTNCQRTNDA